MTEKSNIYEALAMFQEKVGAIGKESEGQAGNRKFLYADLATIMAQIQPVLTECKLAISQVVGWSSYDADVSAHIETTVCHWPSGEYVKGELPFSPNSDPQEMGKQIQYFRRYGLSGILNLVTDDDSDVPKRTQQRAAPKARRAAPPSTPTSNSQARGDSTTPKAATSTGSGGQRPSKQCPACGKGKEGVREGPDYPLLQDREDPSKWFHWKKPGGCGWTGNPDEYVETNRIKQGEEDLAKAAAELQAQKDAENEAVAEQHGL